MKAALDKRTYMHAAKISNKAKPGLPDPASSASSRDTTNRGGWFGYCLSGSVMLGLSVVWKDSNVTLQRSKPELT